MTAYQLPDFIGKTFIAYTRHDDQRRSPAVLEGIKIIDHPEGSYLESVVAFTNEAETPIRQKVAISDIIAPITDRAAGWRIIDEATAQADEIHREPLEAARTALQVELDNRDRAVKESIEIGALATESITIGS